MTRTLATIQELYRQGIGLLREMGVEVPAIEAKVLMLEATGISEEQFFASPERGLSEREEKKFFRLLNLRRLGFPLAYVVGEKEFWSLRLKTPRGVFIPRPETELLVEKVVELSSGGEEMIVDIGTGSGNIAVALAKELPAAHIVATDISAKAIKVARLNAERHQVTNVRFVQGNLYSALRSLGLEGKCDIIVSNPPYVPAAEWLDLPAPIRNHEPRRALVPGKTGLEFIRRLIRGAPAYLKPGAFLIFEVGWGQSERAISLFHRKVWPHINSSNHLVWGRTTVTRL
ncbi:MAG: peptide chain release factor N(5)-glutamine methyltransferase [Candidatus Aminicenantales bacterium]